MEEKVTFGLWGSLVLPPSSFTSVFGFPSALVVPSPDTPAAPSTRKRDYLLKKKNTSQTKSKLPINRWAVLQQDRLDVLCAEANNALQARRQVAESQRTNGRERKRILPQFEADVISFAHLKVAKKLDDSPVSLWETSGHVLMHSEWRQN